MPGAEPRLEERWTSAPGSWLLAVSGGLDSMCLLYLCAEKRPLFSGLQVAHVHHGVRGAEADADARLVGEACARLGLPFHLLYLDPATLEGPGGFECRARDERYKVLQELRASLKLDALATAHHLDDQSETVALRLMRGTTLWGLRGVLARREDQVVRPLLPYSRESLRAYALKNRIPWREDASNACTDYARNRMRHQLLPALESLFPGNKARLAGLATRMQQAWEGLYSRLDSLFAPCLEPLPKWLALSWLRPEGPVLLLDYARLRPLLGDGNLLRLWLTAKGLHWTSGPEQARCFAALADGSFTRMRLGHLLIEKVQGTLWCTDHRHWSAPRHNMYLFQILRAGEEAPRALPETAYAALVDADTLSGADPLLLRKRQDGDRFSPPDLRSARRKLTQWMQENGIPAFLRDHLWVVAQGDEIIDVPGFGTSGLHCRRPGSVNVWELRVEWKKSP